MTQLLYIFISRLQSNECLILRKCFVVIQGNTLSPLLDSPFSTTLPLKLTSPVFNNFWLSASFFSSYSPRQHISTHPPLALSSSVSSATQSPSLPFIIGGRAVENRKRSLKCQPSRDDDCEVQCRLVREVGKRGVVDKGRRWKGSRLVKSLSSRKNA
jgi:hypothetical protein